MRKKKISWCKSIIPCIIGVAASWDPNCHGSAASQGAIVRNSHSRTIILFGSFFDCSAPPQKKGRLVLALPMKEDENGRLGFSNQERHGMHPFEPCLSGKRSFSYLLLEVWFESWCGTPLEKSEWIPLFIYDNLGDALSSFPIHEGNCHSSSLESKPFFSTHRGKDHS